MGESPEGGLQRVGTDLAGADADDLFDGGDEDLAVTDLAGAGRRLDRLDHRIGTLVGDHARCGPSGGRSLSLR
ncbi:hypothetical protein G6F57_010563 [Rhizopus arrhizus]|nr:hypothetical protein G6F57_010563 [Rhizopus arrhizus]